jgi:hypothetical protein
VRRRQADLHARVNGNLRLDFGDVTLTSYAGLELFARDLRNTDFNGMVRAAFAGTPSWGDFGVVALVRVLIGLVILGGRRLRHLAYLQDDVVFRRFAGLRVGPTGRTVSRWLKGFTMRTVGRLQAANAAVVARVLPRDAWEQSSTILSPERLPPRSVAQRQLKPLMEQSLASLRRLGEGTFIQGEPHSGPAATVAAGSCASVAPCCRRDTAPVGPAHARGASGSERSPPDETVLPRSRAGGAARAGGASAV